MFLTKKQSEEIAMRIASMSVKDSDFDETFEITGDDYVAIVQDGVNRRLSVNSFRNGLQNGPQGESAYEVAIRHGYHGTEEQWLNDPVDGCKGNGVESFEVVGEYSTEDSAVNTYRITPYVGDPFDFDVKNGKGIVSVSVVGQPSSEDDATNTYRIRMSDSSIFDFSVKNGSQGNSGYQGAAGELEVVNNLIDGGATAALSAEQGKTLKGIIDDTKVFSGYCYNAASDCVCDENYIGVYFEKKSFSKDSGDVATEEMEVLEAYNITGKCDSNYLALGEKTPYAFEDIDDSLLDYFSAETLIDQSDPDEAAYRFCGFTECRYYKGRLYVFYRRAKNHGVPLGENSLYWYYKFSEDGGKTWSNRMTLAIPSTPDNFRDNRGAYTIVYGNKLLLLGVIAPSTNTEPYSGLAYRSTYAVASANEQGVLSVESFHFLPFVKANGDIEPASDTDVNDNSNVIAGRPVIKDDVLYWLMYFSSGLGTRLYKWEIDLTSYPNEDTMQELYHFTAESCDYSEGSIALSRGKLCISITDYFIGVGHNCAHNFVYDLESDTCSEVGTTRERNNGLQNISVLDGKYILMAGRAIGWQRERRYDSLTILTGGNLILKEFVPFSGHESYEYEGYNGTSFQEVGDTLYLSYYFVADNTSKLHKVMLRTLDIRDISNILFNCK